MAGGNGADYLYGGYGADTLYGGDSEHNGNDGDFLWGGSGDDWLEGAAGNDFLQGGTGADVLYGWDGDDTLVGYDSVVSDSIGDTLYGGAGGDVLLGGAGNDYLYGGSGGDTLFGGAGDDYLYGDDSSSDSLNGGAGKDMYFFAAASGSDVIAAGGNDMYGDCLTFVDIQPNAISTLSEGNDFVIYSSAEGSSAHLQGWYSAGGTQRISSFLFLLPESTVYLWNNGSGGRVELSDAMYSSRGVARLVSMDAGNTALFGGDAADFILGGAGNDTLWGGGAGADTLQGGLGSDTYYFGRNCGHDVITAAESNGNDWIFLYDLNAADVSFVQSGDDLLIVNNAEHDLRVAGWFLAENAQRRILHLAFQDGQVLGSSG